MKRMGRPRSRSRFWRPASYRCAPKKAKAQSGAKFSGMPENPAQLGANAPPAPPISAGNTMSMAREYGRDAAMIGNVVQLRPHDVRWVAAKGPLGLVIR